MPDLLNAADILVSPRASGDNAPLKIFEYMASGKPIVATDILAHRIVLDESRAVLCGLDGAAVAESIAFLIRDPEHRQLISDAARKYMESRFTTDHFRDSLQGIYAQLGNEALKRGPTRKRFLNWLRWKL